MYKIDYDVNRTENCVLIDSDAWIQAPNVIQQYRLSGRRVITYITKVIDINPVKEAFKGIIKKGDTILVSRVASEVSQYRNYSLLGNQKYYNLPISQVLGVFEDNIISLGTLRLLFNKVLYEKVSVNSGILEDTNSCATIGKILKQGPTKLTAKDELVPLSVQINDVALFKDNVSTKITLDGKDYFVAEDESVVCTFTDKSDLESARFLNGSILMSPYIPEKLSNHLWTPAMNYEDEDYTDIYKRDRFKIDYIDPNLTVVKKGDIIWVDRNITTYAFCNGKRYFLITGTDHIEFKELS